MQGLKQLIKEICLHPESIGKSSHFKHDESCFSFLLMTALQRSKQTREGYKWQ